MKKTDELKILYEDNHIIVVVKLENILSQKDDTNDLDMLTLIKEYIKKSKEKEGNVYLGLVHRLDRRVGGVMVFAKTSKAASRLSDDIRNHNFNKKYLAIVEGEINGSGVLVDYLKKVDNRAIISKEDGKISELKYQVLKNFFLDDNICTILLINLLTGRYNQIRAQLSHFNHPIINDFKYGYKGKNYDDVLGLFCYEISFNHPTKKEKMAFTYQPDWGIWMHMKGVNLNER